MLPPICQSTECLLFIDQYDGFYIRETALRALTLEDAARSVDDNTAQIMRLDFETWQAEDVSEQIAAAWLEMHRTDIKQKARLPQLIVKSYALAALSKNYDDRITSPTGLSARWLSNPAHLSDFDLGVGRFSKK